MSLTVPCFHLYTLSTLLGFLDRTLRNSSRSDTAACDAAASRSFDTLESSTGRKQRKQHVQCWNITVITVFSKNSGIFQTGMWNFNFKNHTRLEDLIRAPAAAPAERQGHELELFGGKTTKTTTINGFTVSTFSSKPPTNPLTFQPFWLSIYHHER